MSRHQYSRLHSAKLRRRASEKRQRKALFDAQLCREAEDDTLENWVQKYCFSAITILTIAEQPQKPTAAARSYY